jgi:predicted nucleic acid-binding protein
MFLLTALNGEATHLVTYDEHLETVGVFYPEYKTCNPLEFLKDLRPQQQ